MQKSRVGVLSHVRNISSGLSFPNAERVEEEISSFEALRVMKVTGAIFTPPMFEWTQKAFGKHIQLLSVSGGTDICSACACICFLKAVWTGPDVLFMFYAVVTGVSCLPVYSGGKLLMV